MSIVAGNPKILIIRFSSLGDVVLTTAVLPNLKARWPACEVTVLICASYVDVFQSNPNVNHVRVFDPARQSFSELATEIKQEKFDVTLDLHGNFRSWYVRLMAGAEWTSVVRKSTLARKILVLFKHAPARLSKSVRERALDTLAAIEVPVVHTETQLFPQGNGEVLKSFSIEPGMKLIGIAPGAKHNTKRWPASRFAEAANRLAAIPNSLIVVLGSKEDRAVADEVTKLLRVPFKNLVGWTSLRELVEVTSHLSLLLTNDSGLLHIGEAVNIPVVALFGPTVRAFGFAPYRSTSRVVEVANLSCRPCTLHGDERCPLGHHKCMQDIDVNAVLFATAGLIDVPDPAASV